MYSKTNVEETCIILLNSFEFKYLYCPSSKSACVMSVSGAHIQHPVYSVNCTMYIVNTCIYNVHRRTT